MKIQFFFLLMALATLASSAFAEDGKKPEPISLFGSKPIQLEVTKEGIAQRKGPGYICDLKATLGGGQYSEWGQTEEDARTIVTKKCSGKSGMLLCKKDKAVCHKDE